MVADTMVRRSRSATPWAAAVGRQAHQHALVEARLRVDAQHRLALEVLGDIGHQAVLADDEHHVLGAEQEPVQLVAPHPGRPPGGGDRRLDGAQGRRERLVPGDDLADVLPQRAQEEGGLFARGVDGQQALEVGRPGDQDRPRLQRAHGSVLGFSSPPADDRPGRGRRRAGWRSGPA
jgi:hypothetical protein